MENRNPQIENITFFFLFSFLFFYYCTLKFFYLFFFLLIPLPFLFCVCTLSSFFLQFLIITNSRLLLNMASNPDFYERLKNAMAYGAVNRGELPGDIEDYKITLIREAQKKSPPSLKLQFTPRKQQDPPLQEFFIKVDNILEPAHPMLLLKYMENEGNVNAKVTNKIKYKMSLSVQKKAQEPQQILQIESEEEDSDIPRGKPLIQHLPFTEMDFKPKKKGKNDQGDQQN